jgi:hypothetical protein
MEISINEEQSLIVIKKEVEKIEDTSRFTITSQVKLEQAVEARKELSKVKKVLENQKQEIVGPLNQALKKTRDLFKPYEQRLDIVDSWLKQQMLKWEEIQEAERKKKEIEIETKIAEGEMSFEEAGKKIEKIEKKIEAVPTREISKVEIVDKSKLPLEYLEPDLVAIKRDLIAGKEIAGAKLVKEKVVYNKA